MHHAPRYGPGLFYYLVRMQRNTRKKTTMSNPEIVSSVSDPGDYYHDTQNDRFRGLAPYFAPNRDYVDRDWQDFAAQARALPVPVGRLTLRIVTSPHAAAQVPRQLAEAYVPLTEDEGLLYLAINSPDRQPQLPLDHIQRVVRSVATDSSQRFRPPIARLLELQARGYVFTDHITDPEALQALWGPTFGWTADKIKNLQAILADNARRNPLDRTTWYTSVLHEGQLVAAALAERLDVPGAHGRPLPTVESTEWAVDASLRQRRTGIASGMLALNTAQCLQDLPNARILAECRFSSTAYAAGISIGFSVPDQTIAPQLIARNVWVDGELADFVPITLTDEAIQRYYTPQTRAEMLGHLNQ